MSNSSSPQPPDPKKSVRPDSTGFLPPQGKKAYPDIPDDEPNRGEPGLVGGPTTESIAGTAHDDPLDPLGRKEKQVVVSLPKVNDGGKASLSGRPRETGGKRPSNH